ncbi:MAG: hypothetical protein HRU07_09990 [Nitrosopumilus sp.]|nr:hypothetical protein [Nitrosopumilus sp.]NRA06458.1 hypothetical protein [Nitrosopumilus sp.]
MNQDNSIFDVNINGINAELEITNTHIKCVTGDTVHFEISMKKLRSFQPINPNKILFNIYQHLEEELFQVIFTSKHCNSITNLLNELTNPIEN